MGPAHAPRPPLLGLLVLAAWSCTVAPARAQETPDDPVAALERVLGTPPVNPADRKGVEAFNATLERRAQAVVRPGDLRRALLLPGWGDNQPQRIPGRFPPDVPGVSVAGEVRGAL